jgi:hypothetical protein
MKTRNDFVTEREFMLYPEGYGDCLVEVMKVMK